MSTKEIYLAGGCFWGTEHYFKQLQGVLDTEVGYANGHTPSPTYQDVCTDQTGFAETVRIVYDPSVVSLAFLLRIQFFSLFLPAKFPLLRSRQRMAASVIHQAHLPRFHFHGEISVSLLPYHPA